MVEESVDLFITPVRIKHIYGQVREAKPADFEPMDLDILQPTLNHLRYDADKQAARVALNRILDNIHYSS